MEGRNSPWLEQHELIWLYHSQNTFTHAIKFDPNSSRHRQITTAAILQRRICCELSKVSFILQGALNIAVCLPGAR